MSERKTSEVRNDAAAGWVVRADNGPLSDDEQREFDAWLESDVRNMGAYVRALAVFQHAQRAHALGPHFNPDAFAATFRGARRSDREATGATDLADSTATGTAFRYGRRALLGLGVVALVGLSMFGGNRPAMARTFRTGRGEIRLISLEDGTSLTLDTASEVRVLYDDTQRWAELVEGKALFSVAPELGRPLVVRAGPALLRATDTSFSVRRVGRAPVELLVRDGFLDIGTQSSSSIRAGANSRIVVPLSGAIETRTLTPTQVTAELSWQKGMLVFEDTPLPQAADEFARYTGPLIHIDPAIASETVTGLFPASEPLSFAHAAAESLGLEAQIAADGVVLRRRR